MFSVTGYGDILLWIKTKAKTKSKNKKEACSSSINKEPLLKVLNTFTTANVQGVTIFDATFAALIFQCAFENH